MTTSLVGSVNFGATLRSRGIFAPEGEAPHAHLEGRSKHEDHRALPEQGNGGEGGEEMKKMATIVVAGAVAAVLLAGCSSGGDVERSSGEPASEASSQAAQAENRGAPLNLDGEWVQTNSESADSRQEAVIEGDAIPIHGIR